jgi:outer membrane protein assembly factor BamA
LKKHFTKIAVFILIGLLFSDCNSLKRVPVGKQLLTNNSIFVNGKPEKNEDIVNLLNQKPNSNVLGLKIRLTIANWANKKHDSCFQAKFVKDPTKFKRMSKFFSAKQVNRLGKSFWYSGIHEFLLSTGEQPVILDLKSAEKSVKKLNNYYFNQGFFDVKTTYKHDSVGDRKGKIKYDVVTAQPFIIDTIQASITSPKLDSMYAEKKELSFIKSKKQYSSDDFEKERSRINTYFRNNGAYLFQPNYVNFDIDTLGTNKKVNVNLKINDFSYREGDSTKTEPFKIYKISQVNIITDYKASKKNTIISDSISYKNFNLYSFDKLKYRPKAITDAIFITKGSLFADANTVLTSRYLNNLKIFSYPSITYKVDTRDTLSNSLIANIYLTPKKKYGFASNLDVTRSNIQSLGLQFSPSFSIRNVFNSAETLEFAARYNIGASKSLANPKNQFFNVLEYGLDMKLNFPRILMFFNTEKIIPKRMIPSTNLSIGFSKQENIGLDKENLTASFAYNWTPKANTSARFDLFNIQFIKNINIGNYFKVYSASYDKLNKLAKTLDVNPSYFDTSGNLIIESGTDGFINDASDGFLPNLVSNENGKIISSIKERRKRLTENNLIFDSSFQFSETTKKDIKDETFYVFRTKLESAGNFLSILANASKQLKNQNGSNTILEVEYSQYFKTELEYIKHWDMRNRKVFAFRSFVGIAVPYGNSRNIPFSRSYFAGGSNDIRAWQPYSLGPGKSGGIFDFNEANLKLTLSAEFRFNILSKLYGGLFADAGNIWNVFDDIEDENYKFNNINSLKEVALGTGLGLRYDFNFFVLRGDLGFKTYNPGLDENQKWFKELNFEKSVINIGINYPF